MVLAFDANLLVLAEGAVPDLRSLLVAMSPGHLVEGERGEHVEHTVAQNDVVVENDDGGHGAGTDADATEQGTHRPGGDGALVAVLPPGQLQEHQGHAAAGQGDEVGDEEGTPAVLVADVGESEHVSHPDGEAHHRQEELDPVAPLTSLGGALPLLHLALVFILP